MLIHDEVEEDLVGREEGGGWLNSMTCKASSRLAIYTYARKLDKERGYSVTCERLSGVISSQVDAPRHARMLTVEEVGSLVLFNG